MNTEKMTLAVAFETIGEKLRGSKLTEQAFSEVDDELAYIHARLKLSPVQIFILAAMLHDVNAKMDTQAFAYYADIPCIRIMALQKDFDLLVRRGFIMNAIPKDDDLCMQAFVLSPRTIQAVKYNKSNVKSGFKQLSAQDVMDRIEGLLHNCEIDRIPYEQMVESLKILTAHAQHVEFCRKLNDMQLCDTDFVLFLIAVTELVCNDDYLINSINYGDIIPSIQKRKMICQLKDKSSSLVANGLIHVYDSAYDTFRLTPKAKKEFLQEFCVEVDDADGDGRDDDDSSTGPEYDDDDDDDEDDDNDADDDDADDDEDADGSHAMPVEADEESATVKKLFYNPDVMQQVERLSMLLSEEKLDEVQQRMRAAGMRPGFVCLFYGSPGTGKSETARQLARTTGREIVQVDLASIRNMYVGESEKNIQAVFDDYKKRLKQAEKTPILLFNEADGIFGNRYSGVNDAVDQMENTMQNIILQNLETFEGILIATTNLTANFDKAFERRFLVKIHFEKPNAEVRKQIWMSALPRLTPEEADTLAARYEFTGALIENVVRRIIIEEVLYEHPVTLDTLTRLCDEERIKKPLEIRARKI